MAGHGVGALDALRRRPAASDHRDRALVSALFELTGGEQKRRPVVNRAEVLGIVGLEHGQRSYPRGLPAGQVAGGALDELVGAERERQACLTVIVLRELAPEDRQGACVALEELGVMGGRTATESQERDERGCLGLRHSPRLLPAADDGVLGRAGRLQARCSGASSASAWSSGSGSAAAGLSGSDVACGSDGARGSGGASGAVGA